jgi:hypothetical protein
VEIPSHPGPDTTFPTLFLFLEATFVDFRVQLGCFVFFRWLYRKEPIEQCRIQVQGREMLEADLSLSSQSTLA